MRPFGGRACARPRGRPMTHRHRFRRGVTPRPSDKDLRLLERLLKRADGACRPELGFGRGVVPFVEAAKKAGEKAILPVGHRGPDSVFVRLIRIGKGMGREPLGAQEARAAEISRLVAACRAVLARDGQGRGDAGQWVLPFRKDIDG